MKTSLTTYLAALALAAVTVFSAMPASAADEPGPYRHVVFFKFIDEATPEQVRAIEVAFAELSTQIDTITDYEWGTNVSPEGLNEGFTHCFLVTFADKAGLEVYLPHEAHKAFVAKLKPLLDKVCVVDYVAKEGA